MQSTYPRYYEVEDVFVKLDYDPATDEVFAVNHWGWPARLGKVVAEGHGVTKEEFESAQAAASKKYPIFYKTPDGAVRLDLEMPTGCLIATNESGRKSPVEEVSEFLCEPITESEFERAKKAA